MHRVMEGYVERGELAGLVTLVSRRGETHVDAVGTMAVGGTVPMGRDTVFRISSMTKPITAVATMILSRSADCGSTSRSTGCSPSSPTGGSCGGSTDRWRTPWRRCARSRSVTC